MMEDQAWPGFRAFLGPDIMPWQTRWPRALCKVLRQCPTMSYSYYPVLWQGNDLLFTILL